MYSYSQLILVHTKKPERCQSSLLLTFIKFKSEFRVSIVDFEHAVPCYGICLPKYLLQNISLKILKIKPPSDLQIFHKTSMHGFNVPENKLFCM